ncbi:phage late control D family protein [Roseobacteraceae bacterium S113]
MGLLADLLDPGFRQAASVLIEVGQAKADIGALANLVSGIEIQTGRAEAASGTITIDDRRDEAGQYMAADAGLFAPWEPIVISADFQTHTKEILRGYITALKPSYPQNGGEAKLVIEVMDESAALNREHIRTVWGSADQPVTDRTIVTESIKPLALAMEPGPDGAAARALTQDGRPIQFLRERAKANGFELIFREGTVYFGPKRLESAPQAPILVYAGATTNCLSFNVSEDAQKPDAVAFEVADRDGGTDPIAREVTPDEPLLGTTPVAASGAGLGTPSVWKIKKEGDESEDEMAARAQGLANDHAFKITATGELDGTLYGHVLLPGLPVSVDGTGARNGGLYYVDTVTHQFTPEGYRQQFQLIRNATGEADALGAPPLNAVLSAISSLF